MTYRRRRRNVQYHLSKHVDSNNHDASSHLRLTTNCRSTLQQRKRHVVPVSVKAETTHSLPTLKPL
jgi:hypothetical protein